ncbi:hypothetical protein RJG79_10825 [Mycoplasmatota bacterium WC44]
MLVCFDCHDVFDKEKTYYNRVMRDWNQCPRTICNGALEEIDELMIPTIISLNKKGYITLHCCSGHMFDGCPQVYIKFDNDNAPVIPPDGFSLKSDKYGTTVETVTSLSNIEDDYELYEKIVDLSKILYQWSLSLDENIY